MLLQNLTATNYPYDPQRVLDFSPYMDDLSGVSFYYGIGNYDVSNDNNFRVRFDVEIPNFYYTYDYLM